MNEKGLVANTLYLAESDYGTPVAGRPNLSIGGWAQYVLDSYATVAEAVADLEKQPFTIIAPVLPNGEAGVGHLAISDQSGDSAILEFLGGQLKIHHGRHYTVMTNSPPFDDQLALDAYWREIGGGVIADARSCRQSVSSFPRTSPSRWKRIRAMPASVSLGSCRGAVGGDALLQRPGTDPRKEEKRGGE